jgi:hypothetical protein
MSAFSSQFPEGLQQLGLYVGIGLASLAFVATVWHCLDARRVERGKPRFKLEPSHIIISGLVIAAVGVTWQLYRGAAVVQQQPAAQAASPIVSSPPTPARYYSTADKERISEAFYQLSEILNKPLAKVERDSQGLGREPINLPGGRGLPESAMHR